ncbi:hypothetical protein [Streptomyces sp. NPDC054854]
MWLPGHGKITLAVPPSTARLVQHTGLTFDLHAPTLTTTDGYDVHRLVGFTDPARAERLATAAAEAWDVGVRIATVEGLTGRAPFGATNVRVETAGPAFGGRLRRAESSWSGP